MAPLDTNIFFQRQFFYNFTFFGCLQKIIGFSLTTTPSSLTTPIFHLDIHWLGNWHFGSDCGTSRGDHRGNDASKQAKDL